MDDTDGNKLDYSGGNMMPQYLEAERQGHMDHPPNIRHDLHTCVGTMPRDHIVRGRIHEIVHLDAIPRNRVNRHTRITILLNARAVMVLRMPVQEPRSNILRNLALRVITSRTDPGAT